jgi:DNA ligase 4
MCSACDNSLIFFAFECSLNWKREIIIPMYPSLFFSRYGSGARGGGVSSYLLALADLPDPGCDQPHSWVSFSSVGTGTTFEERAKINDHLKPHLIPGNARPPACYRITGNEKPDVWVTDPAKSIVLSVFADLRLVQSEIYAMKYTMRFPRLQMVRWDKDAATANTVQDIEHIVQQKKGMLEEEGGDGTGRGIGQGGKRTRAAGGAGGRAKRPKVGAVARHLQPTDVAGVEKESAALAGSMVLVCSEREREGMNKAELERLVVKLGGECTQNYFKRSDGGEILVVAGERCCFFSFFLPVSPPFFLALYCF